MSPARTEQLLSEVKSGAASARQLFSEATDKKKAPNKKSPGK